MNTKSKAPDSAQTIREAQFLRSQKNRRGRKDPAVVPNKLARTSAFAPKRRNLITDAGFHRVYVVPGHSVIEVRGRELGSQHRDALYAVFRRPTTALNVVENPPAYGYPAKPRITQYETRTTWRELLIAMGKGQHANNLLPLLGAFEEIKQVVITVREGHPDHILAATTRNQLGGKGRTGSIIDEIEWGGTSLDSTVVIRYGQWVREMIEKTHLVSLNADVQFRLSSDHAKCFWPYIDSQPNYTFVDEDMLGHLVGRDLWSDEECSATRAQFRKDCRQAFNDMVRAGGISDYKTEILGEGRKKSRRYHYKHAFQRQMEFEL